MDFVEIAKVKDTNQQTELLKKQLENTVNTLNDAKLFIGKLLSSGEFSQSVVKSIVLHLATILQNYEEITDGIELCNYVLETIKQYLSSFDEADYLFRDLLFQFHLKLEDFSTAAQILSGANLESVTRPFSDHEKTNIYIKCAESYLEDNAAIEAEVFVNRASPYINSVSDDWALLLRFKLVHARVLDANRKFIEAADRYCDISTTTRETVVQSDLIELLGKAVTCAILSKTSSQRLRILTLLYNDERLEYLDQMPGYASHKTILNKIFNLQIVKKNELQIFESSLQPHQLALSADGLTIVDKAMLEQNVLAVSKLYNNILISELGNMLNVDPFRMEKIVASMITEKRLTATIDQTVGILDFSAVESMKSPAELWNVEIQNLCKEVEKLSDKIIGQKILEKIE